MPTGDAYCSRHLVPSLWDLHMFYLLRPILFRICRYFTGLCSSNIPRFFLDFASFNFYRMKMQFIPYIMKCLKICFYGINRYFILQGQITGVYIVLSSPPPELRTCSLFRTCQFSGTWIPPELAIPRFLVD